MNYKYGECPMEQIQNLKTQMRKRIFFLLLCVDKDTEEKYRNIDVVSAIENLIVEFNGLNELLEYPPELLRVMSLLLAAKQEYKKEDFSFTEYRRLILGAGAEVLKIKEE